MNKYLPGLERSQFINCDKQFIGGWPTGARIRQKGEYEINGRRRQVPANVKNNEHCLAGVARW